MLAQFTQIKPAGVYPALWRDPIYRHFQGTVADLAIDEMRSVLVDPTSELSWAIDSLKVSNPWDLLENNGSRIFGAPDCAVILVYLIRDAESTWKHYKDQPGLFAVIENMVDIIARQAAVRLEEYRRITRSNERGGKEILPRELTPASLYEKYGKPLRYALEQLHIESARRIYRDLVLELTLPVEEMENPEHVDPYTGEAGARDEPVTIKQTFADWEDEAEFIQDKNLHWTRREYEAHLRAQTGGYNADLDGREQYERDLTELTEEGEEKDFSYKSDWSVTEEAWSLKELLKDEIQALQDKIERAAAACAALEDDPEEAIRQTKVVVLASKESRMLLEMLKGQARVNLPQDIAAVALEFHNDYCWSDAELSQIHVGSMTLARWLELAGEEFLEQFQDAAPRWLEITDKELADLNDEGIFYQCVQYSPKKLKEYWREIKDQYLPEQSRALFWRKATEVAPEMHKITRKRLTHNHPFFVVGMLKAAIAGTTSDTGQIAAGWEMFRSMMCPEGNEAFHAARARKASFREAMDLFWAAFNQKFPRQDAIVSVSSRGLRLSSGREVNWHIAAMKYRANELELDDAAKGRLLSMLSEKNWGLELVAALR